MPPEPLPSRLRRAKGSHLLKKVLLGMRNAEDTCLQAADRIDELEQELHILKLAAANAATVLIGPSDHYEGCQEAIDEIRSLLGPKAD